METTLLFESFMVFYLLEVLCLIAVAVWYYKEPKQEIRTVEQPVNNGPTAAQALAMHKMAEKLRREQGLK
jgi:hypothetical protein